jgi:hypothetical protein
VPSLRVDAAHEVRAETAVAAIESAETSPETPLVDLSFDAAAQVQHQASQLATHLVARQRELDHREAGLHARLAQWEQEHAIARLALDERRQAAEAVETRLADRAAELDARERAFRQRETDFRATQVEGEFFLQRQEDELELRESQVRLVEERLTNEQRIVKQTSAELQRARERFRLASRRIAQRHDRQRAEWEQMTRSALATLERRRATIEAAGHRGPADGEPTEHEEVEQLRAALRMELLAVRRLLDEREAEATAWAKSQSAFLAAQQLESERIFARERELNEIAAELDARRAEWDRLQAEGASPEAIATARATELDALRDSVADEFARLSRQQTEFTTWAEARERELNEQSRAMAHRAEVLDRRAAALTQQEIHMRLNALEVGAKRKK